MIFLIIISEVLHASLMHLESGGLSGSDVVARPDALPDPVCVVEEASVRLLLA